LKCTRRLHHKSVSLIVRFVFFTLISNWISRLFWFGLAKGKIQKNAKYIFLKETKTAAFQLRSLPALEAKLDNL